MTILFSAMHIPLLQSKILFLGRKVLLIHQEEQRFMVWHTDHYMAKASD